MAKTTKKKKHSVEKTKVIATHLVLPQDTNTLGTIFGGKVMEWIDIAASVAAMRHCRKPVVTASLDDLHFFHPIRLGDTVVIEAEVSYTGKTSMEIHASVHSEAPLTGEKHLTSTAYLTFVAIDENCKPVKIPSVVPETPEQMARFAAAKKRREERLSRLKEHSEDSSGD